MENWDTQDLLDFLAYRSIECDVLDKLKNLGVSGNTIKTWIATGIWNGGGEETVVDEESKRRITKICTSYRPCVASRCTVEGLHNTTFTTNQQFSFRVITRDDRGKKAVPFGQKLEVLVDKVEFRILSIEHQWRGGDKQVEVFLEPLNNIVGSKFKISIHLDGIPLSESPFTVTLCPVPPPITTLTKKELNPYQWVEVSCGNYGIIYRSQCNSIDVAVKVMRNINIKNIDLKFQEFLAEVDILQRLTHPNIITFLGVCIDSDDIQEWYIVLQWAERGSLQKVLKENTISKELKFQYLIDISRGMSWLHSRTPPIIHFDLKPANILVDRDNVCKISDFGLSMVSEWKDIKVSRGTLLYMPPETLKRKWYNIEGKKSEFHQLPASQLPKIDVYAFGLTAWEVFCQSELYSNYTDVIEFCEAVCDKNLRPDITHLNVPAELSDLFQQCWDKDATERPCFKDILLNLESARIQATLQQHTESSFWMYHWPRAAKVPLQDFVKFLFKKHRNNFMGEKSILNELLARDTPNEVTLTGYRRFLEWFGPINGSSKLLEDVVDLLLHKWVHTCDGPASQGLVLGANASDQSGMGGHCLLRLNFGGNCSIQEAPFTLTFLAQNMAVAHTRIRRVNPNSLSSRLSFSHLNYSCEEDNIENLMIKLRQQKPQYFAKILCNIPTVSYEQNNTATTTTTTATKTTAS